MSAALDFDFDAASWSAMPPAERMRRCLLFAHEASQLAQNAAPDAREAYADLARQWLALAAEIEKASPATSRSS
jgi:hypothetical protein